MVQVLNSSGDEVFVEIKGVSEAMRAIMAKGSEILTQKQGKLLQAANYLQSEIQESIIGNRAEPKSVDTGNFANSINVEKIDDNKMGVYTDVEYAQYLEYGTARILPRAHFRNSAQRATSQINDILKEN